MAKPNRKTRERIEYESIEAGCLYDIIGFSVCYEWETGRYYIPEYEMVEVIPF